MASLNLHRHALTYRTVSRRAKGPAELELGPDPGGKMLELVVVHFDDGREMVIRAMPMRRQYEILLPPQEPPT